MALTQALCTSYKKELLAGTHVSSDTYMIALYTSGATMDKTTTVYSSSFEVANGNGYATGGIAMSGFTTDSDVGGVAWVDWTVDPAWPTATITARGALIYNSTRANKAVAVLDFGADKTSTSGTFTVVLPVGDKDNAIIRLT